MTAEEKLARLERRFNLLMLAVIVAVGGGIAAAKKDPDVLRVRQISVVDANGVERVRIGAPLPEPPILGKRFHRDGAISGILLFDAEGNERTGYATGDAYPNVIFTLDGVGGQRVLFMAEPQGSPQLALWDDQRGALRLYVDQGQPHIRYARGGEKPIDLVPAEPAK